MPIKKRVYKKRKAPARRRRVAGPTRSLRPNHQVATVVETLDPSVLFVENVAVFQNVQLQAFKRCIGMCNLYEQFRIEEVAYTYSPLYSTFQESAVSSPSVPVMYSVMDRLESLNPSTTVLNDLVQCGARRRRFDKPITIRYRPNTMVTTGVAARQISIVSGTVETLQINGADYGRWFPCVTRRVGGASLNTPNTLSAHTQDYDGHWVYFEQNSGVNNNPVCNVAITIRVSFKNPMTNNLPPPGPDDIIPWIPKTGPRETRDYKVVGLPPDEIALTS